MRLFYLTGMQHGISNIVLQRLKVSRFLELNDPFELIGVIPQNDLQLEAIKKSRVQINETYGVLCLSSSWSNPVVWGHYAERHGGLALGFDVPEEMVIKVTYDDKKLVLPIDPVTKNVAVDEKTTQKILSTKFKDWSYENEWRLFVELKNPDPNTGFYFEYFSESLRLSEVILGARSGLSKENIKKILSPHPAVTVRKAIISDYDFQVREDLSF